MVAPQKGQRGSSPRPFLTLAGLAAAVVIGHAFKGATQPAVPSLVSFLETAGLLWMSALQMTILPLVVSTLIATIASAPASGGVSRLAGLSIATFVILLVAGALYSATVAPHFVERLDCPVRADAAARAGSGLPGRAEPAGEAGKSPVTSVRDWITTLVPSNIVRAAADGALLPLIVASVLFGLAVGRSRPESRAALVPFFHAVADASLVLVRAIVRLMPIGVFALALPMAARTGPVSVGAVGAYVLLVSVLLLSFTALLYPIAILLGRVAPGAFARSLLDAQAVAIGTRSSLASLPALLTGAERWLGQPQEITTFVLPFAVSLFKAHGTITSTAKLFVVAHLYAIPLSTGQVVVFLATAMLLSFTTPGIPGGGAHRVLPAYLAAGLPLEGVLLVSAADAIPDIFETLLNVTGDMTALCIVSRFFRPKRADS
jgi:Na+/H+-dicarboxylate symporter